MGDLTLTPPNEGTPRRRGRPRGAKSKRSLDLARYIEATFAGATPGQQAAQLCMVTPKDLREAKAAARELRLVDHDLSPMMLAMAIKAKRLALAIGCETKEAWLLLQKERAELMPYVHQKQAQKAASDGGAPPATVFVIPDGEASAFASTPQDDAVEMIEDFSGAPEQVGQSKSDDAP